MIAEGEARISDLDSHNGTRVNGDSITETQVLASGDVIEICSATLILHSTNRTPSRRYLLDRAQLRRRLEEEIERSRRYTRPLAVATIILPPQSGRQRAGAILVSGLRSIDLVAYAGETQMMVTFPELDEEPARETVLRLLS
jgi:two-component system, NtrC family, response regulator AtoC